MEDFPKQQQQQQIQQMIKYSFICKNKPDNSFTMEINSVDQEKSISWLLEKAKNKYESEQQEQQIDGSIENIFDNLGYFNYSQTLKDLMINQLFYFKTIPKHQGIQIRYSYQINKSNQTSTLIINQDSTIGDLIQNIANVLSTQPQRIQLHYHGKQLNDEKMSISESGIKQDDYNKSSIRVVQLINITLIHTHSYENYLKNNNTIVQEQQNNKIYLNPFQNLNTQISQSQNIEINNFILLDKQNQIIDNIDSIKENDIIILRDISKGDHQLNLLLIDEEQFNESLIQNNDDNNKNNDNIMEDQKEQFKKIIIPVYLDDTIDLIKKIIQIKHSNPYISAFADLDMVQIKGKMKLKDIKFQKNEDGNNNDEMLIYAVCVYQGEISIINRQKEPIPLKIDFKETVLGLKNILENKIQIDPLDQLMYFSGSLLEDTKKLIDYKICAGSRISVEENIFKESLKYRNRNENSNLELSKSNSINLLYKINQNDSRRIKNQQLHQQDNNQDESDCLNMLGVGLNIICICTNSFCKRNYGDQDMIYLKGLGNHLIHIKNNQILVNLNCKRCLSPVKMQSIVFKDCSIIYIKQTSNDQNKKEYHFQWQCFNRLNIEEFKELPDNNEDHYSLYFYVRDNLSHSIEKDSYLVNCLICRENSIQSNNNNLQYYIHPECSNLFSLNINDTFNLPQN